MSRYVRAKIAGGTFFFTVAIADRSDSLLVREVDRFQRVYQSVSERHPFETIAICILPDHLHAIWSLPESDDDFSLRSARHRAKREKGLWQRRYWEHAIRDEKDLARHVDYIHFNPVKHGLVTRVRNWPHSSFRQYVARGDLPNDWGGDMPEIGGAFGE